MDIPTLICNVCHHKWVPRVPNPELCPRCKSRRWNKEVKDVAKKQPAKLE